ncbi:Protein FAM174C [Frankliniella fusca]|uniref:Protein FAM174C n=1 Tax=Frankliniella fusca TaxID=407009 RepID=A0AAE1H0G6_9NEOP|nr:Protein FAM174C [Frankliniella fusca]
MTLVFSGSYLPHFGILFWSDRSLAQATMFCRVSFQCVSKSSKVLIFLVLVISVLCGPGIADDSSANSKPRLNSSLPDNLNISNVVNSSHQKPEIPKSQPHQINSSSESTKQLQLSGEAHGNSPKSDCLTVSCQSADVKQNASKPLASNSSLESAIPVEESANTSDPNVELDKKLNPEALMRGFYVFVGLSAIVMVYIAWKSFGKRPAQVHRYGVITNREDLEMAPLDSDDGDDDDTTHFDLSKHRLT